MGPAVAMAAGLQFATEESKRAQSVRMRAGLLYFVGHISWATSVAATKLLSLAAHQMPIAICEQCGAG
jgi:hypothetical protein